VVEIGLSAACVQSQAASRALRRRRTTASTSSGVSVAAEAGAPALSRLRIRLKVCGRPLGSLCHHSRIATEPPKLATTERTDPAVPLRRAMAMALRTRSRLMLSGQSVDQLSRLSPQASQGSRSSGQSSGDQTARIATSTSSSRAATCSSAFSSGVEPGAGSRGGHSPTPA
jgi:hypothetical protein